MMLQVRRFAFALIVTLVAYTVYAFTIVPFVDPTSPRQPEIDIQPPDGSRLRERLQAVFQADDWELQSPKVLEAEQGMLFMSDYETLDDGRIKITPCTLVFFAPGDRSAKQPNERPFILRAPEGAILQFDRGMDMNKANPGRLVGGRLVGDVTIVGPETKPGENDAVEIATRLVQIERDRIWTPNEVRFQFGPHRGAGRDLTITFEPPDDNDGSRDESPDEASDGAASDFRGVRFLELVHVDELELQAPAGKGLLGDEPDESGVIGAPAPSPARKETLPVEIACLGPFQFDFEKKIASFEEQVDVLRANRDGPSDQLNCERLEIHFGGNPSDQPPSDQHSSDEAKTAARATPSLSGMRIQRIVAVGEPVILRAPASNASGRGDRLEYDFASQEISLADEKRAVFEQGEHRIEARKLRYAMGASGALGALRAAGPGKLVAAASQPGDEARNLVVAWQRELFLRPQDVGHLVSLDGGASVELKGSGGFSAREIHFWFHEVRSAPAAAGKAKSKTSFQPDRMLARRGVEIDTTQLAGKTEQLEIWFENDDLPNGAGSGDQAGPLRRDGGSMAERRDSVGAPFGVDHAATNAKPKRRFQVNGQLIQVQLVAAAESAQDESVGDRYAPREIIIEHAASFGEIASVGESPLTVSGETVHAQDLDSSSAFVRVLAGEDGPPARASARGMTISGGNLQLHQGKNRMWVDGPGELTFPAPKSRPGENSIAQRPTAPVTIGWTGKLAFDGRVAHFERGVSVASGNGQMRCGALDAFTSQPIDFSAHAENSFDNRTGSLRGGEKVELRRLACSDNVVVENRAVDAFGQTKAIEELHTRNLEIDQLTGEITADGAGHVITVRREGVNPFAREPSSGTAASSKAPGLVYLRVDFERGMTGNHLAEKRHVAFHEQVRAVYGPVGDWSESLNPDEPDGLGEKGVVLDCDDLTITEFGPSGVVGAGSDSAAKDERPLEFVAKGNVFVDSRSFSARAARLSYALAKEMLVLEGDGRSPAEIFRRTPNGGPAAHNASRKITYLRGRDHVLLDDVEVLDVNELTAP